MTDMLVLGSHPPREHRLPCQPPETTVKAMLDARINLELIIKALRKEDWAWAAAQDPLQPRSSQEVLGELFWSNLAVPQVPAGRSKGLYLQKSNPEIRKDRNIDPAGSVQRTTSHESTHLFLLKHSLLN